MSTLTANPGEQHKEREYTFDNLRGVLIFLVVFGHLLEISIPFNGSTFVYRIIYSFHMPLFMFISGYFVKFERKRIAGCYILAYIVFQTLYIYFSREGMGDKLVFQYVTPYWILWYLLTCAYYYLLTPFYDSNNKAGQIVLLLGSIFLALWVGKYPNIGYYASLSRFFTFQPWFLLGFYCRKNKAILGHTSLKTRAAFYGISWVIIILSIFFLRSEKLSNNMLYGSFPYSELGYSALTRGIFMAIALAWIIVLLKGFSRYFNWKIPVLTMIGQNTWPVFLLHGFFIKLIRRFFPRLCHNFYIVVGLAVAITLLLGNPFLSRGFRFLFYDIWGKLFSLGKGKKDGNYS